MEVDVEVVMEGPMADGADVGVEEEEQEQERATVRARMLEMNDGDVLLCCALWLVVQHAQRASHCAGEENGSGDAGGGRRGGAGFGGKLDLAMTHPHFSALVTSCFLSLSLSLSLSSGQVRFGHGSIPLFCTSGCRFMCRAV